MNNTLKTVVWIAIAIAVVSLGIAVVLFFATDMRGPWEGGKGMPVDEQRAFDVSGIGKLAVGTSSTDVYIAASQGNRIEVRLHGTVYTSQSEAVPVLAAVRSGEVLEITTERKDGRRWVVGFYSSDLILEIHVPKQYRGSLSVQTSSADVQINDQILSELLVKTSSGSMQLHSVQADTVVMESSSGDQRVEGMIAESSEMTSSSGEIRVTDLEGDARAESSSGDITLRYAAFNADLEARSSSGDVELSLTRTAEFRLEAKSSSGDIDCSFPITLSEADSEMSSNRLFGRVGEGSYRVVVRTSSGDITIRP
jgi:lia operon protein LiaG